MANTYIETSAINTFDSGRRNTNQSLRSLLQHFSGTTAPRTANLFDGSSNFDPPRGMTWYNSNNKALYINDGTSFTRVGLSIRNENGIAALVANVEAGRYESGELVATTSTDPNLRSNAALHLIVSNTQTSADILNISGSAPVAGSVVETSLADAAVSEAKLKNNSVGTSKLKDDAVTGPKIADNTIEGLSIKDAGITASKLADNSITANKYANRSLANTKIILGTINTAEIANGAVTRDKVLDGAINSAKIEDGSVLGSKLALGGVPGSRLTANTVSPTQLALQDNGDIGAPIIIRGNTGNRNLSVGSAMRPTRANVVSTSTFSLDDDWNRLTVACYGLSLNNADHAMLQFGAAASWYESGYNSSIQHSGDNLHFRNITNGFVIELGGSGETASLIYNIYRVSDTEYVASGEEQSSDDVASIRRVLLELRLNQLELE